MPSRMHYSTILFDPYFELDKSTKGIYYHDGMSDNGKITEINEKEVVSKNPYILIYKKYE